MLKLTKLVFNQLKREVENEVRREYNKADLVFSNASPYGQILNVVESLGSLIFQYLESVVVEYNIYYARYTKSVRGLSRLSGHNPFRAISASGTLRLKIKKDINIPDEIAGSRFTLFNNTKLKNRSNGLSYLIQIGQDSLSYIATPNLEFSVNVIQGEYQFQTFTGAGRPLQTVNVATKGFDIENFNVLVFVNGELWTNKNHLYDMMPNERSVVITTSFVDSSEVIKALCFS